MAAVVTADVEGQLSRLGETALRIKRERDEMEGALRDLIAGADMMLELHPIVPLPASFERYVREVKRVAEAPLS